LLRAYASAGPLFPDGQSRRGAAGFGLWTVRVRHGTTV